MATREQVYAKFGIAAEAGQLFETDLGTVLLALRGIENGWHITPDGPKARVVLDEIDRSTLGRLLNNVKKFVTFEDSLEASFASGLDARNRLNHGFYERHNFKIDSDSGRDLMIADLESLHETLFSAWQSASSFSAVLVELIQKHREADGSALAKAEHTI